MDAKGRQPFPECGCAPASRSDLISARRAQGARRQTQVTMLWLKAFHVVFVIAWFAGIFYLPRVFVYHADTHDEIGNARFKLMERRLFVMMTFGAVLALGFGASMIAAAPGLLGAGWLHAKLTLVSLVLAYHGWCYKILLAFRSDQNQKSSRWFRVFNEIPLLLLVAIVILAVVKPF
jgi:putative membrane protein